MVYYLIERIDNERAMKLNLAGKAAAIFIILSIFSVCGELETLLPSNGSYQVGTLVNGSSLESCSIIRSTDKIRPYFAISVMNDPDLIGLLVYFENSHGEVAGEKVRYVLKSYAEEANLTETKIEEEVKPAKADDKDFEETNIEEVIDEAVTTGEITQKTEKAEKNEVKGQKAGELPESEAAKEKKSVIDTKSTVKKADINIVIKSLTEELPYLPLPKNLEIGPYIMVFEAIGLKETLSRTETNIYYLGSAEFNLKDISIYLSGESGLQLISPGTTVMLETRLDFDSRLDPYVIWYNGRNIISEGKISGGAGTILWKAPMQTGFYSLRLEIFPLQLKRNIYTGVSREITLPVSPKAVNLSYFFENNQEHTARNSLATGTAYQEQVRLMTAKAAAVKESGDSSEKTKVTGKDKDKEKQNMPADSAALPPPELLQWYQFDGSLYSSISSPNKADAQSLSPVTKKAPRWAAAGQSYGLSTGSDDAYSLSPVNFFRKENDQGGGIFLFHIMLPAEGVIFSAFFPLESSSTDGVWMDMVKKGNNITLRLSAENTIVEIPVYLTSFEPQSLIPIAVEFYIRSYRLEAKLNLSEEYSPENNVGTIKLSGALSGEGRIRLGGVIDKAMTNNSTTSSTVSSSASSTPNAAESSFEETLTAVTTTDGVKKDTGIAAASETPLSKTANQYTIWDEFAVLFSAAPFLKEEYPAGLADEKQNAAKEKTTELNSKNQVPAVQNNTAAADNVNSIQEIAPSPDGKQSYNF